MSTPEDFEHRWMVERFDRIDNDNKDIKDELDIVQATVVRHGVYWDIVKWGVVSSAGIAASLVAFFGWHKH